MKKDGVEEHPPKGNQCILSESLSALITQKLGDQLLHGRLVIPLTVSVVLVKSYHRESMLVKIIRALSHRACVDV